MLRIGVISEFGTEEWLGWCRVHFDEDGVVSAWLPLPSTATKTAKVWHPVEVGSQVACLMDDECEQGVVAAALWSDTDMPPDWASEKTVGVRFADGAKLYYDSDGHKLLFDAPNTEIEINCTKLKITGDIEHTGDMDVTGSIVASEEVTAGIMKITLTGHKHPTPSGVSGVPTP